MKVLLPSTAEKDLAKFALSLQQLASGRSNATGTVTLATGASSTVVSAVNCSPTSAVFLFPTTADAVPALTVISRKFTASGTYTPSAGMVYCTIECVGGGGAGGGAALTAASTQNGAGGGGGGAYSRLIATAATIGASKAVTIGAGGAAPTAGNNPGNAGGDTSVGTICIAKGGTGGNGAPSAGNGGGGQGGAIGGTGDFSVPGQNGGQGYPVGSTTVFPQTGGSGGNAALGFGAGAIGGSANQNGFGGQLYGGGGSGGTDNNATGARTGGAGAAGIVIITEYCFAGAASPTFISSVGKQTFTISHENSAVADRTFFYLCLG